MAIKYSDDRQVWKNGDVAIAYGTMKLGFTEYSLNSRGDVLAKTEIDLLGGVVQVELSYIPVEGRVQISDSRTNALLWSGENVLELERGKSREDTERFVRGKVQEILLSRIRGEQDEKV